MNSIDKQAATMHKPLSCLHVARPKNEARMIEPEDSRDSRDCRYANSVKAECTECVACNLHALCSHAGVSECCHCGGLLTVL